MSDPASVSDKRPVATTKKRSRVTEYLMVVVILGVIVAAAFFQEQISSFFSLKLWDKGAPGRTVTGFLAAGKQGDQEKANSFLTAPEMKPLMKDGKWQGYFIVSQAGTMLFDMKELAPAGEPTVAGTEFFTVGSGWAEVMAPDSTGKPVKYRLEMKDGWKIREILGGRPATQSAPKAEDHKHPTAPK